MSCCLSVMAMFVAVSSLRTCAHLFATATIAFVFEPVGVVTYWCLNTTLSATHVHLVFLVQILLQQSCSLDVSL